MVQAHLIERTLHNVSTAASLALPVWAGILVGALAVVCVAIVTTPTKIFVRQPVVYTLTFDGDPDDFLLVLYNAEHGMLEREAHSTGVVKVIPS